MAIKATPMFIPFRQRSILPPNFSAQCQTANGNQRSLHGRWTGRQIERLLLRQRSAVLNGFVSGGYALHQRPPESSREVTYMNCFGYTACPWKWAAQRYLPATKCLKLFKRLRCSALQAGNCGCLPLSACASLLQFINSIVNVNDCSDFTFDQIFCRLQSAIIYFDERLRESSSASAVQGVYPEIYHVFIRLARHQKCKYACNYKAKRTCNHEELK